MSEALAVEVLKISPEFFVICFILWGIYSLIKSGKLKGNITFGSDEKRKN
jgi:energy-converting hydrogenase Eha subunit G